MGNPGEKLKTYEHCCYSNFFPLVVVWVVWKYWEYTFWMSTSTGWGKLNEIKQEIIRGVSGLQIMPPTSWSWSYRIRSPVFNRANSSHKWMQRNNHRNWIFHFEQLYFFLNQYMQYITYMPGICIKAAPKVI